MRPVGKITCAYTDQNGSGWAVAAVDERAYPRLCAGILHGSLKSVSLTTYRAGNRVVPVEISVCTFPARPGSWVQWATRSLQKVVAYKRSAAEYTNSITMEPAPTNPFLDILGKLDPTDRAIIETRFTEVMARLNEQETATCGLEAQVGTLRAASTADKAMLAEQVKLFMEGAGKAYAEPYGLQSCASTICNSDDATEVRRAVDRMLTVANRSHMDTFSPRAHTGMAPQKRARSEPARAEPVPTQAAAVPAVVPEANVDQRSPLQRAFSATFN